MLIKCNKNVFKKTRMFLKPQKTVITIILFYNLPVCRVCFDLGASGSQDANETPGLR